MRELTLPLSREDIASLKAYDQVFLTGSLYVAVTKYINDYLSFSRRASPFPYLWMVRPSIIWGRVQLQKGS